MSGERLGGNNCDLLPSVGCIHQPGFVPTLNKLFKYGVLGGKPQMCNNCPVANELIRSAYESTAEAHRPFRNPLGGNESSTYMLVEDSLVRNDPDLVMRLLAGKLVECSGTICDYLEYKGLLPSTTKRAVHAAR